MATHAEPKRFAITPTKQGQSSFARRSPHFLGSFPANQGLAVQAARSLEARRTWAIPVPGAAAMREGLQLLHHRLGLKLICWQSLVAFPLWLTPDPRGPGSSSFGKYWTNLYNCAPRVQRPRKEARLGSASGHSALQDCSHCRYAGRAPVAETSAPLVLRWPPTYSFIGRCDPIIISMGSSSADPLQLPTMA